MFLKSEPYYDAVCAWKGYKAEAARLVEIIAGSKTSPSTALLDVACGTGGHIPYLRQAFTIEGLDLDAQMLRISREKHPDVVFHHGDMADFDLGRPFDVVVSLSSSVGYLRTPDRLTEAVGTMTRHVRPGGVLIVEPFFSPQAWKERTGAPGATVSEKPDVSIVRMVDWREGKLVTLCCHYLVGTEMPCWARVLPILTCGRRPQTWPWGIALTRLTMLHGPKLHTIDYLPDQQVPLKGLHGVGSRGSDETMEDRHQLRRCLFM